MGSNQNTISQLKTSLHKTLQSFRQMTPVIVGVIFFIAFLTEVIPQSFYSAVFTGNNFLDPVVGGILGSIAAGNPLVSYIAGGELLNNGVSLIAVAAFILTWVTVGIVQLPAESLILGKQFAVVRNLVSFLTAILIAILLVFTLAVI